MKIQLDLVCTELEWSPGQWDTTWSFPGTGNSSTDEATHRAKAAEVIQALASVGIEATVVVRNVKIYFPKEW